MDLNTFLARKADVLTQRQHDFSADPARATVTLRADSWVAGFTGARPVKLGAHTILTDSAPGLGGNSLGPSAPEMILGALASCLAHTYLIVAALHAIPLDAVTIVAQGTLDLTGVVGLPVPEAPRIHAIDWQAEVKSDADADAIALLHAEVDRLCPVLNTLRMPVNVQRTEAARI